MAKRSNRSTGKVTLLLPSLAHNSLSINAYRQTGQSTETAGCCIADADVHMLATKHT